MPRGGGYICMEFYWCHLSSGKKIIIFKPYPPFHVFRRFCLSTHVFALRYPILPRFSFWEPYPPFGRRIGWIYPPFSLVNLEIVCLRIVKGPLRNRCPKFFFVQKKLYYITSNRPPAAPRNSLELIFGYVSGLGFPGGLAGHMVSCCYDWFTYFTIKCTAKMILKLLSVATKYIKLFIRNHVRNTFDIAFWDHVLSPRVVLSNRKA